MQIENNKAPRKRAAYTFTEVMVAVGILAVMLVSLYLGISSSFATIKRTRENLRATQILVQRVETLRLYSWDQLRYTGSPAYFQTNFTDVYDPLSVTNGSGSGVTYYGNIKLTVPPPVSVLLPTVSYRGNVAMVTVTLRWTNTTATGSFPHVRTYETLVAKSGMQNYVYGK